MITEKQFSLSAISLSVPVAAIKAVAEVEARGDGFLPTGQPVILFEPHVFWKELRARGTFPKDYILYEAVYDKNGKETGALKAIVNSKYADILYPKWKPGAYGPSSRQHERLARAAEIDREAALSSASWGKFQIMGFNWKECGCSSLQEFINIIYESEYGHLLLFCHFISKKGLVKHLKNRRWDLFAYGYNGEGYKTNKYDKKLEAAFKKYSA